jgi:hypothetical protein
MTNPSRRYAGIWTPELRRLANVANSLNERLRKRVVFIGGTIMPLLQTDGDVFGSSRPTKDVDGVVLTQRYVEKGRIEEDLRELRFRNSMSPGDHVDRWISPTGETFDLVSCGQHVSGTGSSHDQLIIENAITLDLPPTIQHASATGFLMLKCAAFGDRGKNSPLQSKDLTDIVVLAATRPGLVEEFRSGPMPIKEFVKERVQEILVTPRIISTIPNHIMDRDPLADDVEKRVMQTLSDLAAM